MTRVPMMGFNPLPNPGAAPRAARGLHGHGRDRRECRADSYGISRAEQEEFAVR